MTVVMTDKRLRAAVEHILRTRQHAPPSLAKDLDMARAGLEWLLAKRVMRKVQYGWYAQLGDGSFHHASTAVCGDEVFVNMHFRKNAGSPWVVLRLAPVQAHIVVLAKGERREALLSMMWETQKAEEARSKR